MGYCKYSPTQQHHELRVGRKRGWQSLIKQMSRSELLLRLRILNIWPLSHPWFQTSREGGSTTCRRNERLKRKKGGEEENAEVKGTLYNLGVDPMPTKRRGTFKKKKAMVETSTKTPRYSLRSTVTKDNKKPLSVAVSTMKTVISTRRVMSI